MALRPAKSRIVAEFGDFQTPQSLAIHATQTLSRVLNLAPRTILEPTCGRGAFLVAAATAFPQASEIVGVEINGDYLQTARKAAEALGRPATLIHGDFFRLDWASHLDGLPAPLLITGNPPWVTSAELGTLASANLPEKSNFQGRAGIEAITGKSNFDISESMLLQYLQWLEEKPGVIAVLCKTAVARKVLTHIWKRAIPARNARIYRIDALSYFNAAVDACLFIVELDGVTLERQCDVYEDLSAEYPSSSLAFHNGHLVTDAETFEKLRHLGGQDPHYVWRSGVKHDCSRVMELSHSPAGLENGYGEIVDLEGEYLYPVLKSSDVGNRRLHPRSMMLVTQRNVGQETIYIKQNAPKTWSYLRKYATSLGKRGSVIYKGKPEFSIFGVGTYTFTPWKIAISGFYKALNFSQVGPVDGRPVVFDDTVNFLPCATQHECEFLFFLLTSSEAVAFFNSMIHWDEKRPITVEVLRRLSIRNLAIHLGREHEYLAHTAPENLPLFAAAEGK